MEEAQPDCSNLQEEEFRTLQFANVVSDEHAKEEKVVKLLKKWNFTRKVLILVSTPHIAEYLFETIIHNFGINAKENCSFIHGNRNQEDLEKISK